MVGGVGNDYFNYLYVGVGCVDAKGGPGADRFWLVPHGPRKDRATVDMDGGVLGHCGSVSGIERLLLNSDDTTWRVNGTDGSDVVRILGGNRIVVTMRGGDDWVRGAYRADRVDGGPGEDVVFGRGDEDTCLRTEAAHNCEIRHDPSPSVNRNVVAVRQVPSRCHGFRATVTGTPGRDRLVGSPGRDVIVGGGGRDVIDGGAGDDVICAGLDGGYTGSSPGGAEYDVVIGDQVTGGPGDDLIDLGFDPKQLKFDSDGPDRLGLGGSSRAKTVHLAAQGAWGSAEGDGRDRILGQRLLEVRGSPGPDTIWGSPYADLVDGRGGDDVIHGLGGADELFDGGTRQRPDLDVLDGGAGGDVLFSSAGVDLLKGGPGKDDLSVYGTGSTMSGGAGDDYLIYGRAGTGCPDTLGGGGRDTLALRPSYAARHARIDVGLDGGPLGPCGSVGEIEKLFLDYGFGDDVGPKWVVSGTDRGDWVRVFMIGRLTAHLRGGDDTMIGADRDDVMDGGPGDDTAFGHGGHDTCPRAEHSTSCEG